MLDVHSCQDAPGRIRNGSARMLLRTLNTLLATALLTLVLAGAADAGSYDVTSCGAAPGAVNNAWQNMGSNSATMATSQDCYAGVSGDAGPNVNFVRGISAATVLDGGTPAAGATAYWRISAPAGAAITRIRYHRYAGELDNEDFGQFLRNGAGASVDSACNIVHPAFWCAIGAPNLSSGAYADITTNTSHLDFGVTCGASVACSPSGALHKTWASIYGSTVTITESTAPTLAVDTAHGAWAGSSWLKGAQEVRVGSASDTTGIKRLRLLVDGQEVARNDRTCDYTYTVPCSSATNAVLSFNASNLAEGEHALTVEATDAANNVTTSPTKTIRVDATAPAAPQATSSEATITTGSTWSVNLTHGVQAGAAIDAVRYRVCLDGACGAPQTASSLTEIAGIASQAGVLSVRVWAADASGNEDEAQYATVEFAVTAPVPPSTPPTSPTPTPVPTAPVAPTTPTGISTTPRQPSVTPTQPTKTTSSNDDADADDDSVALDSPRLRVKRMSRRGRTLTISGSVDGYFSGSAATMTLKVAGKTYRLKRTLSGSSWRLRIRLPGKARLRGSIRVTVSTPKGDGYAAGRSSRTLRLRR